MCRAQDEGGQRCASHAKKGVASAESRYASTGSADDLQALVEAHTQYASTPEGQQAVAEKIAAGEQGPGELGPEMWQRIARDGQMLRERNAEVGAAIKAAQAKGDAFLKDAREKWGPDGNAYVLDGIRGPKALQAFLDQKVQNVAGMQNLLEEDRITLAALESLRGQIEAAPLNPQAALEDCQPRTEEERDAWVSRLSSKEARRRASVHMREDSIKEYNERFARFGRPSLAEDSVAHASRMQSPGLLVRMRNEDGTVGEQEYIVTHAQYDGSLSVLPLHPTDAPLHPSDTHTPSPSEFAFRAPAVSVTPDRLVDATPEMVAKYGGRKMHVREDRYKTEVSPGEYHTTVRVTSDAANERHAFDEFRQRWAADNSKPFKSAADVKPSFGDRLRNAFS